MKQKTNVKKMWVVIGKYQKLNLKTGERLEAYTRKMDAIQAKSRMTNGEYFRVRKAVLKIKIPS